MSQAFDRACERADIRNLHFHDLRHEATSRLFEKGLNPMQVSAITGHKTFEMLKRYTHLKATDLVKLLN
jgi:integrase